MRRLSIKVAFPLLIGIASTVAAACGDNNGPSDTDEDGTDISTDGGGEPGSGGGENDGSGGGGGTGGKPTGTGGKGPGSGGEGGQTNTGGNGSGGFITVDLPDCDDEANGTFEGGANEGEECWDHSECKGVATEQFLNRCDGNCLWVFDNSRIEDFDGTLPPL